MINRTKILKLFQLSKKEYFADFFITPPITAILMFISIQSSFSKYWIPDFCLGLAIWTLYEYLVHRWISHEFWVFKDAHFLHHKKQLDYIAVPPYATLFSYVVFWALFGFQSSAIMVGFSIGYIWYSIAHTFYHYTNFSFLSKLKRIHALHHRFGNVNFGVTTPVWDKVFKTYKS